MPIYEYKAIGNSYCQLCKDKFEVLQGINDEPLKICPECGAKVNKLFSRPFILLKESLDLEDTLDTYPDEEADELGFEEDFAEDDVW